MQSIHVHEQVLEALLPARHYIRLLLCSPLPSPGHTDFDGISQLMNRIACEADKLALRCDPLLLAAEYDVRLMLLAVFDRLLKDIYAWLSRYESVVREPEPEAWQGKEVDLRLMLQADDEFDALNALMH